MDDELFDEPFEIASGPEVGRRASRRAVRVPKPDIEITEETRSVLELLEDTRQNVFLTGRAGTGKSSLLNWFRATTEKNVAVVAPTGVAAINVGGETIHRFFKFGIGQTVDAIKKVGPQRQKLYQALDMLVVDEVSMVRADLLDCMDRFLRLNGPRPAEPFGGIQVLLIGDPYQLPPVVRSEERGLFSGQWYRSPYFFDAHAYPGAGFETVELTRVYRQSDPDFVDILDAVRTSRVTEAHLARVNRRVGADASVADFQVSLVPRNDAADRINAQHLARLPGEAATFKAMTGGGFREQDAPTAQLLQLKPGAQVMLLNNEQRGRWVNGDLAKVVSVGGSSVRVAFEDGSFDDVPRYTWEKIRFAFDEDEQKVVPVSAGSFTQLPLKLAWAVTIHKGQGKTYDRVSVDFGSGMFAPGQAYVALSRCRSLNGLSLTAPLRRNHVFADPRIQEFMAGRDDGYRLEYE